MATAPLQYWMIAVPNTTKVPEEGEDQKARSSRQQRTRQKLLTAVGGERSTFCKHYAFEIPPLKVGTLDSLMALSDELNKHDTAIYQLVQRIERSYVEIFGREVEDDREEGKGEAKSAHGERARAPQLTVGERSDLPEEYVKTFEWNSTRYPHKRATLRAMVEQIVRDTTKADSELKRQMTEYNDVRNSVLTIERKEQGTLMVRPLGPFVKKGDFYEREFLTTVFVVIPKAKLEEFNAEYMQFEDQWYVKEAADQKKREEDAKIEAERQRKRAADGGGSESKRQAAAAGTAAVAGASGTGTAAGAAKPAAAAGAAGAAGATGATGATGDAHAEPHTAEQLEEMKKKAEADRIIAAELEAQAAAKRREAEEAAARRVKERKTRNIVPGSAKCLHQDAEFALMRLFIMRKGIDTFKAIARDKRFTVREFKLDPEQDETNKRQLAKLEKHKKDLHTFLIRWCKGTYSEVFSAWVHVKAMRIFVEAVLRYGLPVNFSASLLFPFKNQDKKVRTILKELYGGLAAANLTQALDASEADLSGMGQDFYPYVYLGLTLGAE